MKNCLCIYYLKPKLLATPICHDPGYYVKVAVVEVVIAALGQDQLPVRQNPLTKSAPKNNALVAANPRLRPPVRGAGNPLVLALTFLCVFPPKALTQRASDGDAYCMLCPLEGRGRQA